MVRAHRREAIAFKLGPGPEMIGRALFASFWIFFQTVTLVLENAVRHDAVGLG